MDERREEEEDIAAMPTLPQAIFDNECACTCVVNIRCVVFTGRATAKLLLFTSWRQSLHITQNLPGQQIGKHDHELHAKTTKKFVSRPPDSRLCIPACLDLLAACAEPSESRKISSKREKNEVRNRGSVLGLFTSLLCAGRPAANLQPCVISLRKQSAHNYPRGAAGRAIARCTHLPKQS
ncbi:hypothetical protein C0Q70_13754 [Pomacea canaliculata]|uniref:Uncharacterized protein n=1 Tax=Pomacea canaliculata TaxID=400727 RepID=A0A2T7NY55_POMCA|nr:hypothetical protein C0Q70_13754 [Pomacea canaliculata]